MESRAATENVRVAETVPLITPAELKSELPVGESACQSVLEARRTIGRILRGEDPRLLVIAGPCSIHDPEAARDYAKRLRALADRVSESVFVAMRVYFEKPRTTFGWKGLINDPHLDGSFDMASGLRLARRLLLDFAEMGLPAATEMLDPITPQYIDDAVAWAAIGARTTESQTHRQMASGLSMPVGYKNNTAGGIEGAINAMCAAQSPHSFLGIDRDGRTCIVRTTGNPEAHLILRGGEERPNYGPDHVAEATAALHHAGLSTGVVVDCSHANSGKRHDRQEAVWDSVLEQRRAGNRDVIGLMLESHIHEGKQKLTDDPSQLSYGVSITDACVGWEKTEELILRAGEKVGPTLAHASS